MSTMQLMAVGATEFFMVDDLKVVRFTNERVPFAVWYVPTNEGFSYVGDERSREYDLMYEEREPSPHSPQPAPQG